MGWVSSVAVLTLMMVTGSAAMGQAPVSIGSQGWTITASPEKGTLEVSQRTLGVILQDIRIGMQSEVGNEFLAITRWSTEPGNQSLLVLHSTHPISAWALEIDHDTLKISSTSSTGMLTAQAPAPLNRLPVLTLDPHDLAALAKRHLRPAHVIECEYRVDGGMTAVRSLLSQGSLPTALLCGNDLIALGVISALQEANLRVPEDISVVGVADIVFARLSSPPLTTIHVPGDELVRWGLNAGENAPLFPG